jgi:hypothetical protein
MWAYGKADQYVATVLYVNFCHFEFSVLEGSKVCDKIIIH